MIKLKDIVYILTYIIAFIGYLSVARFVSPFISLIFIVMFFTGIYFDRKNRYSIPTFLLNGLGVSFLIFQLLQITLENIVIPIVNILLVLLGIKLLQKKEFRDFMQIYTISVFLLSASALLTIDIIFLIYFMTTFFITVIAVILLTFYVEDKNITFEKKKFKNLVIKLFFIPLISIPLTVLFFLLLPRTDYPIFNFLNNQGKGKTGFSDSVQLGDVSDIQMDKSVIMRVHTEELPKNQLYWRGLTLNTFNGSTWFKRHIRENEIKLTGKKVKQTVILEPYGDRYLFSLDKPEKINYKGFTYREGDLSFSLSRPIFNRVKYTVISRISPFIIEKSINKKMYLQIPRNLDRKIFRLANRLKGRTDEETLLNIIKFFKRDFLFSLDKLPEGKNSLSKFLFEYKYGNCEYFASATAILLRINGIPSRIVVGYRGGFYNKVGKYYIIKQSDAHSWVEAYINGRWIRVDTTPTRLTPSSKERLDELKSISKLRIFFDTLEYYWINFIINYDLSKQKSIFNSISNVVKNTSDLKLKINYKQIAFILILIIVIYTVFRFSKEYIFIPIEKKFLIRFFRILEKKGYKRKDFEGLEEFVLRIEDEKLRKKALEFVKLYEGIIYKDIRLNSKIREKLSKTLGDLDNC
ncbi:MAG: DUF3488 domain-containing protein [Persephonella sp.]|nr:MAG: DUF3488 domain-containing protein [Persephonella sp.]